MIRRRLDTAPPPEEVAGRRRWWWAGGVLGIVAGVLIAFFVVPPLMGHFFGTADVALGDTYSRDGRSLAVDEVRDSRAGEGDGGGQLVEVVLRVDVEERWQPRLSDFRLRLESGLILVPRSADPPAFAPGPEARLSLTFAIPAGVDAAPRILELDDPKVRFHLYPGEPE
jgi:hypothetical protein